VDGQPLGGEDFSAPYSVLWNTATVSNGQHRLLAIARDAAGNTRTSWSRYVTVSNTTSSSGSGGSSSGGSNSGGSSSGGSSSGSSSGGSSSGSTGSSSGSSPVGCSTPDPFV